MSEELAEKGQRTDPRTFAVKAATMLTQLVVPIAFASVTILDEGDLSDLALYFLPIVLAVIGANFAKPVPAGHPMGRHLQGLLVKLGCGHGVTTGQKPFGVVSATIGDQIAGRKLQGSHGIPELGAGPRVQAGGYDRG